MFFGFFVNAELEEIRVSLQQGKDKENEQKQQILQLKNQLETIKKRNESLQKNLGQVEQSQSCTSSEVDLLKSERDAAEHMKDKVERQLKDCEAERSSLSDKVLMLDNGNKNLQKNLTESATELSQLEKLLSGIKY